MARHFVNKNTYKRKLLVSAVNGIQNKNSMESSAVQLYLYEPEGCWDPKVVVLNEKGYEIDSVNPHEDDRIPVETDADDPIVTLWYLRLVPPASIAPHHSVAVYLYCYFPECDWLVPEPVLFESRQEASDFTAAMRFRYSYAALSDEERENSKNLDFSIIPAHVHKAITADDDIAVYAIHMSLKPFEYIHGQQVSWP